MRHWLPVAKHHGLPTRLLDWTFSPFVAMHFATSDIERFGADAAIWVVDYVKVHELLPEKLTAALAEEGANALTVEMLSGAVGSLEDLYRMQPKNFLGFLEPPFDRGADRQSVRAPVVYGRSQNDAGSVAKGASRFWKKMVIPAELKWEIRDKLDQANVTERVLFPGLDGLGRWLTWHYMPESSEMG